MAKSILNIRKVAAVWATVLLLSVPCLYAAAGQGAAFRTGVVAKADTVSADTAAVDTAGYEDEGLWPLNVQSRLDVLLQDYMFETSAVGLMVYDLTADSVIYKYNEKQLMRPASSLKMMVAVAALDRLGSDYRYNTRLYVDGTVDGNVLNGNLYCRGGFDPVFNLSDLDEFVDSVRSLGVDTLRGNLYADLSMKDGDRLGEGWCWDDDNPVLTPLLLSGKDEFMEKFVARLRSAGIVVEGDTREDGVPQDARVLCTVTHRVSDVLPRMMKESDNLYSESLFYLLASSASGRAHVTAKQGRREMNKLVERLGFEPSKYYIADGSGLSLYNYVSPELEVAFLRHAYSRDYIYVPLYASMPIAGMDGTLDDRMRRGHARGNVHAKTGTVTGVSALAGYCTAANGHALCFSIINMGIRRAAIGRRFQDKVCEALCRP